MTKQPPANPGRFNVRRRQDPDAFKTNRDRDGLPAARSFSDETLEQAANGGADLLFVLPFGVMAVMSFFSGNPISNPNAVLTTRQGLLPVPVPRRSTPRFPCISMANPV